MEEDEDDISVPSLRTPSIQPPSPEKKRKIKSITSTPKRKSADTSKNPPAKTPPSTKDKKSTNTLPPPKIVRIPEPIQEEAKEDEKDEDKLAITFGDLAISDPIDVMTEPLPKGFPEGTCEYSTVLKMNNIICHD